MKKFWIALVMIIVLFGASYFILAKQYSEKQQQTHTPAVPEKTVATTTTAPIEKEPILSQEAHWCKTLKDPQARARACKIAQQRKAINHR